MRTFNLKQHVNHDDLHRDIPALCKVYWRLCVKFRSKYRKDLF